MVVYIPNIVQIKPFHSATNRASIYELFLTTFYSHIRLSLVAFVCAMTNANIWIDIILDIYGLYAESSFFYQLASWLPAAAL